MPIPNALSRLEELKRSFSPGDATRVERLLAALEKRRFPDAAALVRFHEALLFLRAYPHSPDVLLRTERILAGFAGRVARLRAAGADLSSLDAPEVSGIAGTVLTAYLSYDVASCLVKSYPSRVDIDWENYQESDRLAALWRRLFPLVEEDSSVEAHVPYLDWLSAATHGKGSTLKWLAARLEGLPIPVRERAELFDSLQFPTRWDLGSCRTTRTLLKRPVRQVFYHSGPLLKRSDVSLAAELAAPGPILERVGPAEGARVLGLARETSAVRFRELYGFTYGDARHTLRARPGRGVEVFLWGLPPGRRLPLRAYHAAMMFKNGVPVGYFETLTLFERMEVGFNLYYTFREGETVWLFAKLLKVFNELLRVTCFSIDPYQIGHENKEAIDSGAFWFYRKLGFRPTVPALARLAETEEALMGKDPSHRTSARTLRRLASGPMIYEMPGREAGAWDRFHIRNVGLSVQRMHLQGEGLAPVVGLIPDLARWSREERARLANILRAKTAPEETRYVHLLQRHSRLRAAMIALGSQVT